jgi:hypothetical protein
MHICQNSNELHFYTLYLLWFVLASNTKKGEIEREWPQHFLQSILVFGVHHKPCGLTSLPSCHLSQVHKVQHQPTKKMSWGTIQSMGQKQVNGASSGAPDIVRCPSRGTSRTGRSRVFSLCVRYNSSDCPVCERSNSQLRQRSTALTWVQWTEQKSEVWIAKSERTGLSGAAIGQKTSTVKRSKPQRLADVARTGQWTVQCSVHHRTVRYAHRQQTQTMARKWLEAINTPNHLHSSHPSFQIFTFNTRAKTYTPRHNQRIKSSPSSKINLSA